MEQDNETEQGSENEDTSGTALTGEVVIPDESQEDPEAPYPLQKAYDAAGLDNITPEMRREVLGRLVEFETCLSALTVKQQNFVLAVLADPTNLKKAARVAGFTGDNIQSYASTLIIQPKIAHCVALGQLLREDRTMVSSDRTLNELSIIAYPDISHFTVKEGTTELTTIAGVPTHALRAVSQAEFIETEVTRGDITTVTRRVKIKLWSKTDALRMLALYQRLFTEGGGGGTKIVDKSKHVTVWQFGERKVEL